MVYQDKFEVKYGLNIYIYKTKLHRKHGRRKNIHLSETIN